MPSVRAMVVSACLALSSGTAHADALDDLRQALRGLPGKAAVSGNAERKIDIDISEKPREQASVKFGFAAGPAGLQLTHAPEVLALAEADRLNPDPDKPRPFARALDSVQASELAAMLNVAPALLHDLERAKLRSETSDTLNGASVRLLEFELPLRMPAVDLKRVKESSIVLKLWLGADGVPVAAERSVRIKGRVMMIGFEIHETLARTLVRRGDRLLGLREERRLDSSGFGASTRDVRITALQLQ